MVEISLVELNCSDFDALARFVDDKPLALSLAVNGAMSCSRPSSAGRSKRLALGPNSEGFVNFSFDFF